jgi:hypothetical protein
MELIGAKFADLLILIYITGGDIYYSNKTLGCLGNYEQWNIFLTPHPILIYEHSQIIKLYVIDEKAIIFLFQEKKTLLPLFVLQNAK